MVDSKYIYKEFTERLEQIREKNTDVAESDEAIVFAQVVKQYMLDDPLTAVFPPIEEYLTIKTEKGYRVTGIIGEKNQFGVTVRMPFTLNVSNAGGVWECSEMAAFSTPHKKGKRIKPYLIVALLAITAIACIIMKMVMK